MSSSLDRWVSDELHTVSGISDKTIAEYFVSLAKQSSSSSDLIQRIRDTDTLQIDPNVEAFAQELFSKVPRREPKTMSKTQAATKREEQKVREMTEKRYDLIKSSSEDDEKLKIKPGKNKKKSKKEKKKKTEEGSKKKDDSSEDEFERQERERREDLKERDELAKRLVEKDKDRTRKIAEKSDKRGEQDCAHWTCQRFIYFSLGEVKDKLWKIIPALLFH